MSIEINSVIIGGNLTRDVVIREIGGGQHVASLSVASNRTFMMQGQKKKEVIFVDVDVWGVMAQNCGKYLTKGSPVVVTGRLKQDQWQSPNGEKRTKLKIVATNVQFLSSAREGTETPTEPTMGSAREEAGSGGWE